MFWRLLYPAFTAHWKRSVWRWKWLVVNFLNFSLFVTLLVLSSAISADDELPQSRAEALAMEARGFLPITRFYDPPQPLVAAVNCSRERQEAFDCRRG